MIVVLDTNIMVQDFWFRSLNYKTFIEGMKLVPVYLKIPEVVFDETINKYREILSEKYREYEKSIEKLNKMFLNDKQFPVFPFEIEMNNYQSYLGILLSSMGCEYLAYPEIDHRLVVKNILERRKPFRNGDDGYRDFLIWQSIRSVEQWGTEEIVFITNNTKDFGEEFLSEEYTDKVTSNRNIKIIKSIKDFNEIIIIPKLEKFNDISRKFNELGINDFNFNKWFSTHIENFFPYHDLELVLVGFPYGVGRVVVENIQEIKDININEISEFSEFRYLFNFIIEAFVEIEVHVDWDEYHEHKEVRKYLGENLEKFEISLNRENINLKIKGSLIFDNHIKDIDVIGIDYIEGPYGEMDY